MTAPDSGGPAFPVEKLDRVSGQPYGQHKGISTRKYLAAKAMQAAITAHISHYGHDQNFWSPKDIAAYAYEVADAMIAADK